MKNSKKPEAPETAEVPLSSMIDVVFLLIIFFVVTAAVDKEVEDEKVFLSQAPHGKPVTKKDPRAVVINIHQDGVIKMGMLNNCTKQQISRELEAAKTRWGNEFPIIIRADHHAQHGFVKEAMEAVTNTGLYTIKINAQMEGE